MAYIYIGQYIGKSWRSAYIKLVTGFKQSHTSAFLPPLNNTVGSSLIFTDVIEAWAGGVDQRHWTKGHEPGTIIDVYRVECTDEQAETFYAGMHEIIGDKYDFPGLIWFRTRLNLQRDNRWFCSEAVMHMAEGARISLLDRVKAWQVSPGLLNVSPKLQFVKRLITPQGARNERMGNVGGGRRGAGSCRC